MGSSALRDNTANSNTAFGTNALLVNTSGSGNVAVGNNALDANTTGVNLVGIGFASLSSSTTANSNTGVGKSSLESTTTGGNNCAFGHNALVFNTTGANNCAYGFSSLFNVTTGSGNTAIGEQTGNAITTGGNNTMLGKDAGRGTSPSGEVSTASNQVCIGDNSVTNAFIKVAFTVTSDQRDKIEDGAVSHGLDFVNQLKPKSFWFRKNRESEEKHGDKRYGFYAQDILALEGSDSVIIDSKDSNNLKFRGDQLIPVLVNAIKELSAKVTALEAG